ncbi:MAG: FHA domain-containing protein [Ardenticatenaceae bacterium]|nr:FHA domain-containing protein [Anaerolineales bacterium]MCB8920851.1 FHA domain-containing protein [Ardenticatenaceae bacterium]MCB8991635.1 FHA domain-containing protein [Ardenticatenaceae bacterium]MCB9002731.1 FHA domain-containing protein [Ardenticatenaceae bacterium]
MRKRFAKQLFFITLTISIALFAWAGRSLAQDAIEIAVNDVQAQEGTTNLTLEVYLTLDAAADDLAVPESAVLLLDDGGRYPAQLSKPPYYVALVLDTSGSMSGALETVQQAIATLVEQAPPQTYFAVIRFDEDISLVQPFTNDPDAVVTAVNSIETGENGTCLYDATVTAVQSLEQVAGEVPQRALVLFTDGRDERRVGESGACSNYTFEQVVDYASNRQVPVPFYIAGLSGSPERVNLASLQQLADATNGQVSNNEAGMTALLHSLLDDIHRQWLARMTVQPSLGVHRGALLFTLDDQSQPPAVPVTFAASRSYVVTPPPLPPLELSVDNFTYNEVGDMYSFDVALSAPQQANSLGIDVLDADNVQVARSTQPGPLSSLQRLTLRTTDLDADGRYTMQVSPLSAAGRAIVNEDGSTPTATYEFTYNPPRPLRLNIDGVQVQDEPALFNLRTFRLEDDVSTLLLYLHVENGEQVTRYEGTLTGLQDNQQVGDSFTVPVDTSAVEPQTEVPAQLLAGTYTLALHALGEDGQRLASARYTFHAVNPDGALARAIKAWQANPLLWPLWLLPLLLAAYVFWRLGVRAGHRHKDDEEELEPEVEVTAVSAAPPALLKVLESPDATFANGNGIHITHFPYTIGREGCNLTIADDRHISRRHAEITFKDGIFYLTDFGSSNGTFVNEARCTPKEPTPLSADIGAKIRVGKTTVLSFKEEQLTMNN